MNDYSYVKNIPLLTCIKNSQLTYLAISDMTAKFLGWNSSEDACGKTDYDLPCSAVELAPLFATKDKKVLASGKRMLTLDVADYADGRRLMLGETKILTAQMEGGNFRGLIIQCLDVTDTILFRAYSALHQFDQKISPSAASYILSPFHCPFQLTEKQEACLFLLVRGKSAKQIAYILNISPRTAESYLVAIKEQLNCQSKSALIEKAIDLGYLYYVPETLQNNLDKVV
jgi:DNA-binding CsgD family transcriptional regulator